MRSVAGTAFDFTAPHNVGRAETQHYLDSPNRSSFPATMPAQAVFRALCRVGGGHGWYVADWLWKIRGWIDVLVGGPGLRRGRRDPEMVGYGEALDFWRVVGFKRDRRLALRAEMRLPGEAMLEFQIEPRGENQCLLRQTALFQPRGLFGMIYWYAVVPLHHIVFRGMLRGIQKEALQIAAGPPAI